MVQRFEHAPGEVAPVTGTYEQLNIFGRLTGIRVALLLKDPFPKMPRGNSWTLVEEDKATKPS